MKKYILLCLFGLFLVGCEKVDEMEKGKYKPGMYFGYHATEGERANVATAVVFVDENGFIKDVFLDTTYMKDGVPHTKQALGEDYAMRVASPVEREWFEQADDFAAEIVKKQDLGFVNWVDPDETTIDSVSGVTMQVDDLYKAVTNALSEAK